MMESDETARQQGSLLSRIAAKPTSRLGRLSVAILVIFGLLVVFNTVVLMPTTEGRSGADVLQAAFNALVGVCVLVAGSVGLAAVILRRERSWAMLLSIALMLVVLVLNIVD